MKDYETPLLMHLEFATLTWKWFITSGKNVSTSIFENIVNIDLSLKTSVMGYVIYVTYIIGYRSFQKLLGTKFCGSGKTEDCL